MKKKLLPIFILIMIYCTGCEDVDKANTITKNDVNKSSSTVNVNTSSNITVASTTISTNKTNKSKIVVDDSQKNYQEAYNEYVRCLRECGPQSVETLQALADYQNKYQIYQMILKAEASKN